MLHPLDYPFTHHRSHYDRPHMLPSLPKKYQTLNTTVLIPKHASPNSFFNPDNHHRATYTADNPEIQKPWLITKKLNPFSFIQATFDRHCHNLKLLTL